MEKNYKSHIITKYLKDKIESNYGKIIDIKKNEVALTNQVFKITTTKKALILKLLSKNKSIISNRLSEIKCLEYCANKEFTPKLLQYKLPSYLIIDYIEKDNNTPQQTFNATALSSFNDQNMQDLGKMLANLHQSNIPINIRNYEKTAKLYIQKIHEKYLTNPIFKETVKMLSNIFLTISKFNKEYGVCHNDLNLNNFIIDTNQKIWLLDFEYASINDVYVDISTLKKNLSPNNFITFCNTYCEINKITLNEDKLNAHLKMMSLLSILWCFRFSYDKIATSIFITYNKLYNNK